MFTSLAQLIRQAPRHQLLGLLQAVQGLPTRATRSVLEAGGVGSEDGSEDDGLEVKI